MTDTQPQSLPAPGAHDAPSLHDFEPLLLAELIVLRAAARGDIAKVGYRRPRSPTPDVRLRAEFLAFLARGGSDEAPVAGRRLQIMGACVIGRLDLAGATVPMSLWLYRCTFGAVPLLDGARVLGSLSFADSALPGLRAEGCRIDAELAIGAGCSIDGEIRLARTVVGGDLTCERLRMRGGTQAVRALRRTFVADGMRIGGDVNLQGGVEAVGEVRFVGAQIEGDLRASTAHLTADIDAAGTRGVALNLDRLRIGGSVLLDRGFSAAGTVRMQQARIHGDLDCRTAAFDTIGDASWGECGSALRLDRVRIGGTLILQGLLEPLQGASLADARVGTLADDAGSWGQGHVLDGFAYTRLGSGAPTDAAARIGWLTRQDAAHVDLDFRPDPWRRTIGVLRRMGHDTGASALSIGRERHLRRIGRIGLGAPTGLRWLARLGHAAWGMFAGYGHRPWRPLGAGAIVWLLCAGVYWAATCRADCTVLQPLLYSLDVLLPWVDLHQQNPWAPSLAGGLSWLGWLSKLEAACGWALVAMWLAALFGVGDRDRRVS